MSARVSELRVDQELDLLLRHHSENEEKEFQKDVERDGKFIDPIVYWMDNNIPTIIDGHRRFKLWKNISDSGFVKEPSTVEMFFPDKDSVKKWMIRHQLGRRNLTKVEFDLFLGKLYHQEKKMGGDASQRIADEFKVSATTVRRDAKFAEAVEKVAEVAPEVAQKIVDGEKILTKSELNEVAQLPPRKRKEEVRVAVERSENKPEKIEKPKKNGAAVDIGKLCDEIKSGFVKVAVKNIEKIAELNGGKDIVYKNARMHLEEFTKLLKDMRDGFM